MFSLYTVPLIQIDIAMFIVIEETKVELIIESHNLLCTQLP